MSNFQTQPFLMNLAGRGDRHQPHVEVEARVEFTPQSGGFIIFSAFERGTLMGKDVPANLHGTQYSKPLGSSTSVNAFTLRSEGQSEDWLTPTVIEALGKGELTGDSAEKAIWSLFFKYVLLDPKDNFVSLLDSDWLTGLRRERANTTA